MKQQPNYKQCDKLTQREYMEQLRTAIESAPDIVWHAIKKLMRQIDNKYTYNDIESLLFSNNIYTWLELVQETKD